MRILIVDDIKGWRDYHSAVIRNIFQDAEIQTAESAQEGYNKLIQNNEKPFDIILTDMQMEDDFEPKYAGEWLIEQTKTLKNCAQTKVVIISATYNIEFIANKYGVQFIKKTTARNFPQAYDFLQETNLKSD